MKSRVYTSVVFLYSMEPPAPGSPLPPAAERKVTAPTRVIFVPGWNVPIHTSSLQNATWTKQTETFEESRVRYLSIRTTGDDIFGPHHISFICDMPAAGTYKVGIKAVQGPDQGIVQMYERDKPVGKAVNLYAEGRSPSPVLPLGTREMSAGDNIFFLNLVDKDARSNGLGIDLVEIVFERIE